MRTRILPLVGGGMVLGSLLVAGGAAAQPQPGTEDAAPAAGAEPAAEPAVAPADPTVSRAQAGNSPVELPGETYYLVGARYRATVVPKFMMNLFGDGGRTVVVHGAGPEFGIRKDGFETNLSIWLASYRMKETAFKAKDDPEEAWEIVESKIKVLYLTSDFLWSSEFSPEFAINYGLGAGFGFVFGDLFRTQAYNPGGTDRDNYEKCAAPGDPRDPFGWCQDDNDHYSGYTEPSWANGGSKPVIFPWLALQTGFRFKPHRNFASRLDLGFGTSGFFFGFGADYGL